jgi:hypothetical protein
MFAGRYFAPRYWAGRFFAREGSAASAEGSYFGGRYFASRYFAPRYFSLTSGEGAGPSLPAGYLHARAGIFLAGVTHCGLVPREPVVTIGGVVRGIRLVEGFQITHVLGQPSVCTLQCYGYRPIVGQQLVIADESASSRLIFGGLITAVRRRVQRDANIIWDVAADDWSGLINAYQPVYLRLEDVAVNVAINRILAFTDPALAIRPGLIPASLGRISQTFEGTDVMTAIGTIAGAVNAYYRLTPWKRIDLFQGEALDGNALVLDNDTRARDIGLETLLNQQRTRVQYEGGGGSLTALASVGATTLEVDECGWYDPAGGTVRVGVTFPTYTGVSAESGPGLLTGCAGVTEDLPQGAKVNLWHQATDAAAVTARASLLGGGLSGIAIAYARDERLNRSTLAGLADRELAWGKDPTESLTWTDDGIFWWPGKLVTVDLTETGKIVQGDATNTAPSVSGELRLQSVAIRFHGAREEAADYPAGTVPPVKLTRDMIARPGRRASVVDILVGAP